MMLGGAEKNRFLAQAKEGAYRVAKRSQLNRGMPKVTGTISEFVSSLAGTAQEATAKSVLHNKVKVCPTCGKPNGFTLATCNKCQQNLANVETSFNNNLFSAFMLGIEREPRFPLTLSMRLETERVMVFDDPLALSPLHFCAIPATAFIPDWRYLALRPKDGLAVSRELVQSCHTAAEQQFLSDREWCSSLVAGGSFAAQDMVMGYNFPPSQNQLHVQYMMPLLIPHQYMMFLRGVHYTYNRFFPVSYVERVLSSLIDKDAALQRADLDLPIEDLVTLLEARSGVSYEEEHAKLLQHVEEQQKKYANWKPQCFGGICHADDSSVKSGELRFEAFAKTDTETMSTGAVAENAVYEREKAVLQNYGKGAPGDAPNSGYYSYARALSEIDMSFVDL